MQPDSGKTLGSFVVEEPLGGGGMGELLLGHQPTLNRFVVLKTLRRDLATKPEFVERFHREACLAASVHHQNVVCVYDCFSHRGNHYIALEHVDGLDLRTILLRAAPLPARVCGLIALECARGIEAIHVRGMVHRDIKPANILIGRQGETKIVDFGIALDPTASPLTQTGLALGSPPYMSPEQLQADRVDARSDVYGLGAVLYELLAGHPPYHSTGDHDDQTLLEKMQREKFVPLEHAAPQAPRYLRGLVRSCLRTKAKRRLGSMGELRVQLERRLGRPTTADARQEIAACLWDLGLFEIRDGETVLARVPQRRPNTRARWIGAGVVAALLGALATVMFQQRASLDGLASSLPEKLPALIESAKARLRGQAGESEDSSEDNGPGGTSRDGSAGADSLGPQADASERD
jgi:serine/threonine protein kinase